jgi:alpha-1,2-mannosyltransferase
MSQLIEILRSGEWVTRERARLCAIAILIAAVGGVIFLFATSEGLNDFKGRPLGADYSNVYAAGTLALDGHPEAPFDPARQSARQKEIFGADTQFYSWHYPPYFLLLAAPLAALPYFVGLLLWQLATLALYLLAIRAVLRAVSVSSSAEPVERRLDPLWLPLALAFPAVFVNLGHGNNGFLTAALIGGALALLDRRPTVAGILFGCLAYKPQLALLIPLVLALTGRWRVIMSAAATVAVLTLVTTAIFGLEPWRAFIEWMPFTRVYVLENGGPGWEKIQSVFSWVRMWGGSVPLAYAIHGATALALTGALVWMWRRRIDFAMQAAALCIVTILATPYVLDYDLMTLGIAIAYLAALGQARGFLPYEKTALAAAWLVPFVARSVTQATLIPLAVPTMLTLFGLLVRRAILQAQTRSGPAVAETNLPRLALGK